MIYICIPAYDEAATVGLLLWKIRRVMGEFPRDYEILVLDDASTDATQDVLAPYTRVLPLTVLRNAHRQGYAPSIERLLEEAVARATHPRRDVVVVLQADFSEAPEEIPALVKRMEGGADVVEGAVVRHEGEVPRRMQWVHGGVSWLLRRAPLPEGSRDPLSGFRAYRVSVLKRALAARNGAPLLSREGWAANLELLLAVAPHARRIDGTDVVRRYDRRRRETRFRPWNTLVQLWDVARRARRAPPSVPSTDAAS
ncbi:MAG TPA: glycosyltransferase family 2 protein [Longimicrobiaceae bacterium]|nr:glycosyltransferase family 2 protein [Longimicrobiaceae bacterium]